MEYVVSMGFCLVLEKIKEKGREHMFESRV